MPDNQPTSHANAAGPRTALQSQVLALDGPDAVAFAHAQFCNDVAALPPGRWQWNAWLTAKGRVVALFALLRTGEQALRLLLPDMEAEELAQALRRYVFRRKVAITPRPDLHASGRLAAPLRAQGPVLDGTEEDDLELDFGGPALPRSLYLSRRPADADAALAEAWAAADLRLGLPRLPAAQREQWTPQQLSLERLAAYSVRKGCYPGQEIVARTHFLGKAKRGLVLLRVPAGTVPGAEVAQAGATVGTVVSAAGHDPRLALAVLPLERDTSAPLQVDGAEAVPEPFVEGLARA